MNGGITGDLPTIEDLTENDECSFVASLRIYQFNENGDTFAIVATHDEDVEVVMPVPAHMAAQLPMAIAMLRSS